MNKNKRIGHRFIIIPLAGIALAIIGFSITAIISALVGDNVITGLINWASWFIGLLSVVCIPVGVIYLYKKEIIEGTNYDERSGKKQASVVPDEIKRWNWGAAGLTWIWGVYYGVWISLLVFIPLVNIIMWIILGIKGNEWAWRAEKWKNTEEFIASQKKWRPLGIAFFVLGVLGLIMSLFR